MKAEFWRKSVAALLAASLLSVAAIAQQGEGEVDIEAEKPAATAPADDNQGKDGKPIKPQIVDRDPFVNTILSGEVNNMEDTRDLTRTRSTVAAAETRDAGAAASGGASAAGADEAESAEDIEEIEVPAPEVTITGIVGSSGGRMAIVSAGPSSHIVRVGQKMADYSVTSITDTSVTFTYMSKSFEIPLIDEFGNERK